MLTYPDGVIGAERRLINTNLFLHPFRARKPHLKLFSKPGRIYADIQTRAGDSRRNNLKVLQNLPAKTKTRRHCWRVEPGRKPYQ
jgi:hypothetical protein